MHRDVFPEWSPGPSHPRPIESQVDVWRIGLALPNHPTADPTAHRTLARAAMRDVLARYLDRPAGTLGLSVQPGGKPFLDFDPASTAYWCLRTMGPVGPDGQPAYLAACGGEERKCFRAPEGEKGK